MFTKGPWQIKDRTRIYDKDENYIGSVDGYYENSKMPGIDNAKLIACAPELFDFVKMVLDEHLALGIQGDATYITLAETLIHKVTK